MPAAGISPARAPWRELALASLLAALAVLAADLLTGETGPRWDGRHYLRLAKHGLEPPLVAPFAYRPGTPYLVRGVAELTGMEVGPAFRAVVRTASGLALLLAYVLARGLGAGRGAAALVAGTVALTHHHLRFPLFFWSLVDAVGFALVLAACSLLFRGRWRAGGLVGALGILFKEFLALPWLVALFVGARGRRSAGWFSAWLGLLALGLAAVLAPRLALEVASSEQSIDPFNRPETLSKLWTTPANGVHLARVLIAYLTYWLPTLLLSTRARWRSARRSLGARPEALGAPLALLLGLHFLLVLYGGVNVEVFAAYAVPMQVALLALLLGEHPPRVLEGAAVLALLALVHRSLAPIPDPRVDEAAYLAFHHSRRGAVDWARLGELGLVLAGALAARFAAARASRRQPRADYPVER